MKKHILITGSTDGIGKLAAQKLALEGHHLYLHGRNAEKLGAVIEEIKVKSQNQSIKGFVGDFSKLDDVRKMADHIKEEVPELDVLINNAGIYNSPSLLNKEGLDIRYVVNYLAPYVLTNAILPILKKNNGSRIINLGSAAQAPVVFEVLKGERKLPERATYAQSKLALTMWSFYLAQKEPELSVIALNPGSLLNTNMVREAFGHHWSPADKGGNIIYDLAVSEKYAGISGKYFDNDNGGFGTAHADAYNENAIEALIKITESLIQV
ncbi:MAG: SDR family NAD(P)-dependent oxidoreductase [Bacteroidota bacterium]